MTFLLDVNVVIALIDPTHVSHDIAHDWFARDGRARWATCPIVENGVIRIVGNPRYPNTPGSPALAAQVLRQFCSLSGHEFWQDSVSLLDGAHADIAAILTVAEVTDSYLLALAAANGGKLATLDRRLSARAVAGGKAILHYLGEAS